MPNNGRISFSGDCTLSNVKAHHQVLINAFRNSRSIKADLSEVGTIDISFIQLIVSAAKTATRQSKSFVVESVPQTVQSSFLGSGVNIDSGSGQISML